MIDIPDPGVLHNDVVTAETNAIKISVSTEYESYIEDSDTYQFVYYIIITNGGDRAVQLLDRHWIITDLEFEITHVKGEGVIGKQPVIKPGEHHSYTSYTMLRSPTGSMEGSYGIIYCDTNKRFEAKIPCFKLYAASKIN